MSTAPVDVQAWTAHLAEPFRDRPVIAGFEVLAGMTRLVTELAAWGARRPLLISRGIGTGPLPAPEDAEVLVLEEDGATSMTETVRASVAFVEDLPAAVVSRVEAYDPGREAVWLVGPFVPSGRLLDRPVFGGRAAAWATLEDKTRADELWDAAGVPRAPAVAVPPAQDHLIRAARSLDEGDGTVWAGDARDGVNGGADFVRWVTSAKQAAEAYDFFARNCDRVRVMPFLEGVPCSIHGIVLPDGVAVLRPVEMVVLRRPETGRFVYGGISTYWDPAAVDREEMRGVARRTGELLAERVRYRGGFSVDGVLTRDGFRPTELNPRFSGGLSRMARGVPELPVELLQLNLTAGRAPGLTAQAVEELLLSAVDDQRTGDAMGVSAAVHRTETDTVQVVLAGGSFRPAPEGTQPAGAISAGPNAVGAFVRFAPAAGVLRRGDRMAPYSIAMRAFADRRWSTDFGPIEAAPDVRRPA